MSKDGLKKFMPNLIESCKENKDLIKWVYYTIIHQEKKILKI